MEAAGDQGHSHHPAAAAAAVDRGGGPFRAAFGRVGGAGLLQKRL